MNEGKSAEIKNNEQLTQSGEQNFFVQAPPLAHQKGGGAIRSMGEKVTTNPVSGKSSISVPIATSPGRSGFGPHLTLSYDSGAGNGPFGFGLSLALPAITRESGRCSPQYQDDVDSDVFILSGAEDLVPMLRQDQEEKIDGHLVRRYRPRVEGLFARIERWNRIGVPDDVHWRSISKDNILTLYGLDTNSRIADPADSSRIFSWLICETRDDKGNAVLYRYKEEDGEGVDLDKANERNRGGKSDIRRTANRYLKRIYYGNRGSLLNDTGHRPRFLNKAHIDDQIANAEWMFEVVFDYGDHDPAAPKPKDNELEDSPGVLKYPWISRPDPFSTYRPGFEVRTTRLCQRVLMFHHFPDVEGMGADYLVWSTNFTYTETPEAQRPVYTFLKAVSQTGHCKKNGGNCSRSMPPVEFIYSEPIVQDTVEEVDPQSLENLPVGLDGNTYRWLDLHQEGISGIFTETAEATRWLFKRNLSPVSDSAQFAPMEVVAAKPNISLRRGAEFTDLAGDGQLDVVTEDGFFEHDDAEGWLPFKPFTSRLNRNIHDPNLKFIALGNDGRNDIVITEQEAFIWHKSLGEAGFAPALRIAQTLDEEKGPRVIFADATQSIYLADLSGDGLTDIVRIRNGEVCYWPNLGHCRFGAKVTMDNAPWFDHPDQFDQKRIRLADIDGSGTTDIIYLHRDGVRLYFNQSGNGWGQPHILKVFPRIDDLVSIMPVDMLGNGTTCLVWSSPLPGDARRSMRYVNLMGGQKPHLLIRTRNNLGAETSIEYAPSTKFYLQDKLAGRPWITRLPFPVHVVEKVTVTDCWRGTTFSTTYSYHHGYFDGVEREFRGFGRVEQIDVEEYGTFTRNHATNRFVTQNETLYQPPIKTVSWFHTGACFDRQRILSQFAHEYFPRWLLETKQQQGDTLGRFRENLLPEPELHTEDLSSEEWREALRACKGMMLRQEVYELDTEALKQGEQRPVKLFTAAYHNCSIRCLQPKQNNRHAVFLVTESEAITYHYELDLRPAEYTPDPRIAHTLHLQSDEYGNILQSVAIVYPRRGRVEDDASWTTDLSESLPLIHQVQNELHLSYTETRYTDDYLAQDDQRLRVPCEILTYELTGIRPEDADDLASTDPRDNLYFTIEELRRFRLSPVHQENGEPVAELAYHQHPRGNTAEKRLVEHVRMLFFKDDKPRLEAPYPLGQTGRLGLPYETYKLALTNELLDSVFADASGNNLLNLPAGPSASARQRLDDSTLSGYLSGPLLKARFAEADAARFTQINIAGQYWIRSGIAGFSDDAAKHFYLPERYTDPFGNTTTLSFDEHDLYIKSSSDPVGNTVRVDNFDFRVLAPREIVDINDNHTEVYFDALGMVVASAVKGKRLAGTWEGDNLDGFNDDLANPARVDVVDFCTASTFNEEKAREWLGDASARFVYHFGESVDASGAVVWESRMADACGIVREKHVGQMVAGETSPIQVSLECSDGSGNVLMKKVQAEPDPVLKETNPNAPLRWIINGLTILNNKGKPVKQYEPAFVPDFGCELPQAQGVTPIIYYDAVGRLIRTDSPDGSFSRVEFSPWHVESWDANDTVKESQWYRERLRTAERGEEASKGSADEEDKAAHATPEEKRSARLTAFHADTPSLTILDSLGREVIAIAHNRQPSQEAEFNNVQYIDRPWQDERHLTFTKLDAEGKPLWIRDARGNLVMQYISPPKPDNDAGNEVPGGTVTCYDIAGNLLFQHSMDAGDRWMLNDAAGKPMLGWEVNNPTDESGSEVIEQRVYSTTYDALHRPLALWLKINAEDPQLIERFQYGEEIAGIPDSTVMNLRGQLYQHYDQSGLATAVRYDFKGKLLEAGRQLAGSYKAPVIGWQDNSATSGLEDEIFVQLTEYDALGRMSRLFNWHKGTGSRVAVYEPVYNPRGVLESEQMVVRAIKRERNATNNGYEEDAQSRRSTPIVAVTYNAKGQREMVTYGNTTLTRYWYNEQTFRLEQLRTTRPGYNPAFPGNPSPLADDRVLQDLYNTYDPVGNIAEIRDAAFETAFFKNQMVEPQSRYIYDSLYRLINATGREDYLASRAPGQDESGPNPVTFPLVCPNNPQALRNYTQSYRYDCVGNIREMRHVANGGGWTRCYAYAETSNRLLHTWQGDKDFNCHKAINQTTYVHDLRGNMRNLANVGPEHYMQWDYRDMIRTLNRGGGGRIYYNYDSGKQRTRKVNESQAGVKEWECIYLGGFEIYRKYSGGEIVEEIETHHLVDGESRLLLVEDVLQTNNAHLNTGILYRYQYSNHLGSAVLELNDQAGIISYEEYHPYGTSGYRAVSKDIQASAKRYRYTGKERDEESGLYYHGARYYACWLGRWVSCDPAGFVDGSNIYTYVNNSPIKFIDISGERGVEPLREFVDPNKVKAAAELIRTLANTGASANTNFVPIIGAGVAIIPEVVALTGVIAFAGYTTFKAVSTTYAWYEAVQARKESERALDQMEKRLAEEVDQMWRNGVITDEQRLVFRNTGTIPGVLEPAAPSAQKSGPNAPPDPGATINPTETIVPEKQYEALASLRQRAGLPAYSEENSGTVARAFANNDPSTGRFGISPSLASGSQQQRAENIFQGMTGAGEFPNALTRGQAQPAIHAEADAMGRAYLAYQEKYNIAPKSMTVFADRPTCNWCKRDLPAIARLMGLERLEVFSGGDKVPWVWESK